MHAYQPIRQYLAAVRSRLRRNAALGALLVALTAFAVLALAIPLLALQVDLHHGATVLVVTACAIGIVLVLAAFFGVARPFQRFRSDHQVARYVGALRADVASDVQSAVEFASLNDEPDVRAGHGSRELMAAFMGDTARTLDTVRPAAFIPIAWLQRLAIVCTAALSCLAASVLLTPSTLRAGWERVLDPTDPRPFGGALMSSTPLVGDIRITVEYPGYTGRDPLILPSASGDIRAMPGSSITLETTALQPVLAASILLEEENSSAPGSDEASGSGSRNWRERPYSEIEFELVNEHQLRARFPVTRPARYRVSLEAMDHQRHVEAMTRTIEMERDRPPVVQLYAPGDNLDVTRLKRIELAYVAEDDYGIAKVELVYEKRGGERRGKRGGERDGPMQRKSLPLAASGQRTAEAKILWDLAELALEPGVEVSYRVEVTDNDDAGGPNIGRSEQYSLRVFSPREKHEALVERQRELLERILQALASRLTANATDLRAYETLQREAADIVVELGTLSTALRDDELSDGLLRKNLDDMRSRLDQLTKAEAALFTRLHGRPGQQTGKPLAARMKGPSAAMIAELENDAIALDDWVERQLMENVLAMTDELEVHRLRVQELFKEYHRTGSPELLAEIDRELRSIETRMADMAEQRARVADDVLDRFVNSDALTDEAATDCMTEVRALMDRDAVADAERRLARCTGSLDDASEALELALRDLRGDRFSEQERRFAEVMDRLADLSLEQIEIADNAQSIWDRYAARADEMMREEAKDTRRRVHSLQERLSRGLVELPENGLTPFAKEELDIARSRLADVDKMLSDGDIAEALAMADLARKSMRTAAEELDAAMIDERDEPWSAHTSEARRGLGRVEPMVDKLVAELAASTPAPSDIMSRKDRRELDRLSRRQHNVAERSRRLVSKAEKLAEEMPGRSGEALVEGVGEARAHMERSRKRMRSKDPSGARQESKSAAEALRRTVEITRDAARGRHGVIRAGLRDEPIRIPGADQYKAPEAFREHLMEAMQSHDAPPGFGSLVKRYYQELIR